MKIVFIENNQLFTDSLVVAQEFFKSHDDVLRDIRNQIDKLNKAGEIEFSLRNFAESTYTNDRGRNYPKINLTEDAFAIVAMSYVTPEAMKMKVKFLNEFRRMRDELLNTNKPSYMIDDPISRAQKWIDERKEFNKLATENLMLEQRVKEYEPKISYLDTILQSKDTVAITQIAKDYGLSGQALNQILHEEKVQYKLGGQWLLYHKYQDKGFTKSQTIDVLHNNGDRSVKMNTKWTQKGRLFIHEILAKRGIVPYMDRQHQGASNQ